MSERSERIANFRQKMKGSARLTGGTASGTFGGASTRTYNIGSGSNAVRMTISADGQIAGVTQVVGEAAKAENSTPTMAEVAKVVEDTVGKAVGKIAEEMQVSADGEVIAELSAHNGSNEIKAIKGTLTAKGNSIGIEEGEEMVFRFGSNFRISTDADGAFRIEIYYA